MPSTPVNELGRFKTWHFTSVLQYSPDINLELERLASAQYSFDKVLSSYALARRHIEKQISQGPDCVTFVSCRFSRKDVAAWLSNAATRTALPDLPLEAYIQSKICIGLDRLHNWLENALWTSVGGNCVKLQLTRFFVRPTMRMNIATWARMPSVQVAGQPNTSLRWNRCAPCFLCNAHNALFSFSLNLCSPHD